VSVKPRRGRAAVAQSLGGCRNHANSAPLVSSAPRIITMFWGVGSTCAAVVPIFVAVDGDMTAPDGTHDADAAEGVNVAGVGGRHTGPHGTWLFRVSWTWTVPPPWRLVAGPGQMRRERYFGCHLLRPPRDPDWTGAVAVVS
jgi:hypothetical protein